MIKIEVMDDGVITCEVNGKLSAIISESLAGIRAVYVSLAEKSEDAGKIYKKMFKTTPLTRTRSRRSGRRLRTHRAKTRSRISTRRRRSC